MKPSEAPLSPVWREGDVILGLYDVRGVVGSGDFGTVCRVFHLGWRKDLAVKYPNDDTLAKRRYLDACLKKARAWADLGLHPNIVTCFYIHEIDGIPNIFMEYTGGGNLGQRLSKGLHLNEAFDYAIQVCMGMAHAHKHGVIHGNLSPQNCLLTPDGSLKISDFGLGGVEEFEGDPGILLKALEYLAPERWQLSSETTQKSDIYSFGVMLYEAIVGEKPFGGEEEDALVALISGINGDDGKSDALASADIPPDISLLITECLSNDPDKRPESFARIEERLREAYLEVTGNSYPLKSTEATSFKVASLNKKGVALYDTGLKDDALRSLEDAIRTDPSHLDSGYNHTLLLWERGKMTDREVVRWLEMKVDSHAGEWRPLYLLGLAHMARRDTAAAEAALQEALRIASMEGSVKTALEEVERVGDSWPHYLLTLKGHEHTVNSVDISQDSRFALSGSDDRTLR